ncbi:MAG: hypothetical protein WDM89_20605 [Rhizomicrobium sp.]
MTTYAQMHDAKASEAAFDALPKAVNDLTSLQRDGTHSFAQLLLNKPDLILASSGLSRPMPRR